MFRKLINTTDDLAITVLRLVLEWSSSRTVRKRRSAGLAATDSPAPWPSSPNRRISLPVRISGHLRRIPRRHRLDSRLLGRVAAFGIACNMVRP